MRAGGVGACVLMLALTGCGGGEPVATEQAGDSPLTADQGVFWDVVLPEAMSDQQIAQKELCMEAAASMGQAMMGRLSDALDSGGPIEAIAVCHSDAPAIAAAIGGELGVSIGRTSFRLRNPTNTPPPWAASLVVDRVAESTFLVGPAGEMGAFLPIRLQSECLMCHGSADTVTEEVAATISENYPDDQAVGFAEGDLRGWLWVEVPPVES